MEPAGIIETLIVSAISAFERTGIRPVKIQLGKEEWQSFRLHEPRYEFVCGAHIEQLSTE